MAFQLEESFRCRFAAGENSNHRLNLLLLVGSNPFFGRLDFTAAADTKARLDFGCDMPKLKTKSGAKKRFSRTATGKIKITMPKAAIG